MLVTLASCGGGGGGGGGSSATQNSDTGDTGDNGSTGDTGGSIVACAVSNLEVMPYSLDAEGDGTSNALRISWDHSTTATEFDLWVYAGGDIAAIDIDVAATGSESSSVIYSVAAHHLINGTVTVEAVNAGCTDVETSFEALEGYMGNVCMVSDTSEGAITEELCEAIGFEWAGLCIDPDSKADPTICVVPDSERCSDGSDSTFADCTVSNNWMDQPFTSCSNSAFDNESDCTATLGTYSEASCTGAQTDQATCEAAAETWTPAGCTLDKFPDPTDPLEGACTGTWLSDSETCLIDSYVDASLTDATACLDGGGVWDTVNCTINEVFFTDVTQESCETAYGVWISQIRYSKADLLVNDLSANFPLYNIKFGSAMAMSSDGSTLVIGTHVEQNIDDNGSTLAGEASGEDGTGNTASNNGAVWVYKRNESTYKWVNTHYLKPFSNSNTTVNFGQTVAVNEDGSIIAVGAPKEELDTSGVDNNPSSLPIGLGTTVAGRGAVYVFELNSSTGNYDITSHIKKENPSADENDIFGANQLILNAEGDELFVGSKQTRAPGACVEDMPNLNAGSGVTDEDNCNNNVGGGFFIAGSPNKCLRFTDQDETECNGNAIGTWFTIKDGTSELAVTNHGSLAIYRKNSSTGDWGFVTELESETEHAYGNGYKRRNGLGKDNRFGQNAALSGDGNTLAVGEGNKSTTAGPSLSLFDATITLDSAVGQSRNVLIFKKNSSTGDWEYADTIESPATADASFSNTQNDRFGVSISLNDDGTRIAIGALQDDSDQEGAIALASIDQTNDNSADSGALYVYSLNSDGTIDSATDVLMLKSPTNSAGDQFGVEALMSAEGNDILVTAVNNDNSYKGINGHLFDDDRDLNRGMVFHYQFSDNEWSVVGSFSSADDFDPRESVNHDINSAPKYDKCGQSIAATPDFSKIAVGCPSGAYWEYESIGGWQNTNYAGRVFIH